MDDLMIYNIVRNNLHAWGVCDGVGDTCPTVGWLCALLNWRGDEYDLRQAIRHGKIDVSKLKPFAGPNGYALFKAWEAKHGKQAIPL